MPAKLASASCPTAADVALGDCQQLDSLIEYTERTAQAERAKQQRNQEFQGTDETADAHRRTHSHAGHAVTSGRLAVSGESLKPCSTTAEFPHIFEHKFSLSLGEMCFHLDVRLRPYLLVFEVLL